MEAQRPSIARLTLILVAVGIAHRLGIFLLYLEDLNALVESNPGVLTWQYPTLRGLRDHLLPSLLYWQQTPPLPVLVLGVAVKLFGWPYGAAYFCIALQQALGIVSAVLVFRILCRLGVRPIASAPAAGVFLLSIDLVVSEYNAFGQTFYEALAMTLLIGIVHVFLRLARSGRLRETLILGALCGALALTRAPFAAYFLLPLALLPWLRLRRPARHALVLVGVALALPGGWALKNLAVYGTISLSGSSWTGSNFAHGLREAGLGGRFRDFTLSERERYPTWFVAFVTRHGAEGWPLPYQYGSLPAGIRERDAEIQAALSGTNRNTNTVAQRVLSELFLRAYLRFAREYPVEILGKLRDSYVQFWEPIRNYAIQYVDLLFVEPVIRNVFELRGLFRLWTAGRLPEPQRVMQGAHGDPRQSRATRIPGANRAALLLWLFEAAAFHLVVPALLVGSALRRLRGGERPPFGAGYPLLVGTVLYAAGVFNLAEHGENMRFRLTVEPVICVLALYSATRLPALWRGGGAAPSEGAARPDA